MVSLELLLMHQSIKNSLEAEPSMYPGTHVPDTSVHSMELALGLSVSPPPHPYPTFVSTLWLFPPSWPVLLTCDAACCPCSSQPPYTQPAPPPSLIHVRSTSTPCSAAVTAPRPNGTVL
nr:striated muscle preferentially expressed protein kinase-like [Macaca nemestrina]